MSEVEQAPSRRRRRWLFAAIAAVILASLALLALPSGNPAPDKLPVPNGYDDLIRAGEMVKGPWPNKGDFVKTPVEELRAFIETNRASLDLARVGLRRECVVPIEDSAEGLEKAIENCGKVRNVSRLFRAEAIVFAAEGRMVEASKCYREVLEVGQAMTQGGLANEVTAGFAIQGMAIQELSQIAMRLPNDRSFEIIGELNSLENRRVSLETIEARRLRWYRGAYPPWQRALFDRAGMSKKAQVAEQTIVKQSLERVIRPLRFLEVRLAIHAFHEDRKKWPRTVKQLVPDYLPSIPVDPSTTLPLEYPANEKGELTDDLGAIGRPDGLIVKPQP